MDTSLVNTDIADSIDARPREKTPWWRWIELVAAGTALISLVGVVLKLDGPAWATILIVWVLLVATAGPAALALQEQSYRGAFRALRRDYERDARFAKAMRPLHDALHDLRDAGYLIMESQSAESYLPRVVDSLNSLAAAFGQVTGTSCRVTVKEVLEDEEGPPSAKGGGELRDLYVADFARSGPPPEPRPDGNRDWVSDNTDFEEIVLGRRIYFLSNDLTAERPYKNSHWTVQATATGSFDYLATIVVPIRKTRSSSDGERHDDLLGFLCIDNLKKGSFDPEVDIWLAGVYADTLYTVLKMLVVGVGSSLPSGRSSVASPRRRAASAGRPRKRVPGDDVAESATERRRRG